MSFTESVTTCLRKYAVFSGRAGRPEYWWFFLFNVLVSLGASFLDAVLHLDVDGPAITGNQGVIGILVSLVLLVPNLSVAARRLHDTGRSGWWLLLLLVPCLGIILLIVFWCSASEPRPNKYGEPAVPPRLGPRR